jgi:hypothetical protein
MSHANTAQSSSRVPQALARVFLVTLGMVISVPIACCKWNTIICWWWWLCVTDRMREGIEPNVVVLPILWDGPAPWRATIRHITNTAVPFVPLQVRSGDAVGQYTQLSCSCLVEKLLVYHLVMRLPALFKPEGLAVTVEAWRLFL